MREQIFMGNEIIIADEGAEYSIRYFILGGPDMLNPETRTEEWGILIELYDMDGTCTDYEKINYLSNSYDEAIRVVEILKRNQVTPCVLFEVMDEILADITVK